MLVVDLPPVIISEVRESDEIRREERIAEVVVLQVDGAAHLRRRLVYKAEYAPVVADPDPVFGRINKLKA